MKHWTLKSQTRLSTLLEVLVTREIDRDTGTDFWHLARLCTGISDSYGVVRK